MQFIFIHGMEWSIEQGLELIALPWAHQIPQQYP